MAKHNSRTVLVDGETIRLTGQEFTIFMLLFNARGRCWVNMARIIEALYPDPDMETENAANLVRVHIYKTRRKLGPTRFRIINRYGCFGPYSQAKDPGGYALTRLRQPNPSPVAAYA